MGHFAAQMELVDFQIGRVVQALERIGELDNTRVHLFLCFLFFTPFTWAALL